MKRVKFGVSGHFLENAWREWPEMLMYLDHLQTWLVQGHGLLTFVILAVFDLVKRVKFGVSGHFPEYAWREWPEIWYAAVSWPHSELIILWLWSGDFLIFVLFWLSEMGKIWGFQAFWSWSVDFPHYGDPLAEIGHIWGFWALSGERVEVNVERRAEAYFRRFASSAV